MGKWFKWTVEFEVHKTWVEDGFDLTDDRAKSMIEEALPYSNGHETKAKVIASPDPKAIRRVQGYADAADQALRVLFEAGIMGAKDEATRTKIRNAHTQVVKELRGEKEEE